MALFRRRPVDEGVPDEGLSFLTRVEADRVRALVRAAFAERGHEVAVHADHVVGGDGTRYGLYNIAASCRGESGDWRALVDRYVASVVSSIGQRDDLLTLDRAALLPDLWPRLTTRDQLTPRMTYAREVAGDLVEVLTRDMPETVQYLNDAHVDRLGPAQALFDTARGNLASLHPADHEALEADGVRVEVLMDESLFTATLLLTLDRVAAEAGQPIDPTWGALAVVPNRHQAAFWPWRGGLDVVAAITVLARFGEAGFRDVAGALSPHVWWWRPGGIEQVSFPSEDQAFAIVPSDELMVLLNQAS